MSLIPIQMDTGQVFHFRRSSLQTTSSIRANANKYIFISTDTHDLVKKETGSARVQPCRCFTRDFRSDKHLLSSTTMDLLYSLQITQFVGIKSQFTAGLDRQRSFPPTFTQTCYFSSERSGMFREYLRLYRMTNNLHNQSKLP